MKKKYLILNLFQPWLPLVMVMILTMALRIYAVSNGNFPFWFDPGRDAIISREILEKRDLKIQGPNASGTHDTVYHGVLHYYLVGPLYTWFGGNPQLVAYALALISSLTILAVYGLTVDLTQDKRIGWWAAFLYAVSYDGVRAGTWISNPFIASITIPFFFWLLWRIMFAGRTKEWPWLTLTMALTTQSVIFFGLQWLVVAAVAWWQFSQLGQKFIVKWKWPNLLLGLMVYFLGISSMVLAQFKAWKDGIFTIAKLGEFAGTTSGEGLNAVLGTVILYVNKTIQSLLPTYPVASVLLVLLLIFLLKQQKKDIRVFLLAVFTSPLWLLSWHFRNMNHSLIGLEAIVTVVFAIGLNTIAKIKTGGKFLAWLLTLVFLTSQWQLLQIERIERATVYYLPQGAYFHDQLAAIDFTYQQAAGQPFSLSTITNPYGYNTLWSYLYNWYGQSKYGYLPQWYGPDQAGLFGGDLLARTASPSTIHVSIYEPPEGIPDYLVHQFTIDQNMAAGTVSATRNFGTLKVEVR